MIAIFFVRSETLPAIVQAVFHWGRALQVASNIIEEIFLTFIERYLVDTCRAKNIEEAVAIGNKMLMQKYLIKIYGARPTFENR